MHKLQTHILKKLTVNPWARYSDLKPKLTEGNLFMYHLKLLIMEGLVQKKKDGLYELTSKGKHFVDKLSLESFAPRIQPKIVTLVVCQNEKGEYLLYLRRREPFFGFVGFPYGKIHLGESIREAAIRELEEKTGLSADLKLCGDVYLTVFQGEELLTQMLCHVFYGDNPKGELKEKSKIGKCYWEKITGPNDQKFMPGVSDIFKLIQKKHAGLLEEKLCLFFEEFTYHI